MVTSDLRAEKCNSTQSCSDLGERHSRQREPHMQSLKVETSFDFEKEKAASVGAVSGQG